jgi:hypothetical protein
LRNILKEYLKGKSSRRILNESHYLIETPEEISLEKSFRYVLEKQLRDHLRNFFGISHID